MSRRSVGDAVNPMKTLLIYPYPLYDRSKAHEDDIRAVPVGLYYVGALLREKGRDVEILNWHDIHKTPEKIVETLREKTPDILGFSLLNANRWGGLEIATIAKQLNPAIKIVFGGVAATFLWEHFLAHFPQVDYVITGEGEYPFLELVEALERGDWKRISKIGGLAFRQDGRIQKNDPAGLLSDLDAIPIPARYFTYQHVVSSRGCPGRCAFCGSPQIWGRKVRFRSPENFVQELALLYDKGVRFFYFSDDTFTVNRKRVIEICRKILARGLSITWVAISRVDCVDEEMLLWMRKAGCIQISFGVESGSESIRKVLGKPLPTDTVKRAFALTVRYGILARAYFIYGSPGETWETIQQTLDLVKEIKPFVSISYILEIYPGTRLYADYRKRSGQTDDLWLNRIEGLCYFQTDPALDQEQVLAFGRKIRQETYANVRAFVDGLDLVDREELAPFHADFCSRLGMTLTHGDYEATEGIDEKERLAERLFRKALGYAPDHRAYLGLGLLKQKQTDLPASAALLEEGAAHFPASEDLRVCLAVTYMNLGRFEDALSQLLRFRHSPQAIPYIAACYGAMGDREKEAEFSA